MLDYLDKPNVISRVLISRRRRKARSQRGGGVRTQPTIAGFESGGRRP